MVGALSEAQVASDDGPELAFLRGGYRAAAMSESYIVRAAALAHLIEANDDSDEWAAQLAQLEIERALATDERRHLDTVALLDRPTVDVDTRLGIAQRLRREPGIRRAWLVRRKVRYLPDQHEHLLFLDLAPSVALALSRKPFPEELHGIRVVPLVGTMRRMRPKLSRIRDAEIAVYTTRTG